MKTNKKDRFINLIDEHKKIIYKIVNSYCPNRADRKDLEQEIIIQLWRAFDKYNSRYKYSTWMYRIALNTAISFYRKEKKRYTKTVFISDDSIFSLAEEDNYNGEELNRNIRMLQEFIHNLKELDKALILLYLEDKSYGEIAEILGITKTNVSTKIGRIKLKLKKKFKKYRIMETDELKELFASYDAKLDRVLQLKEGTLKKIEFDKIQKQTRWIFVLRSIEVGSFSILAIILGSYIANNWAVTHLAVSGIIIHIFTLIALVGSIGQLVLLQQINYEKPIIEIRKKIEKVNSHSLLFLKLVFLSAPVWWSYPLVALDYFFNFDLYPHLDPDFVRNYVMVNAMLIFPLIWFLSKLNYKNLHIKWIRKTIGFFTGTKTKKALEFLNEMEKFEK